MSDSAIDFEPIKSIRAERPKYCGHIIDAIEETERELIQARSFDDAHKSERILQIRIKRRMLIDILVKTYKEVKNG